MYIHSQSNLYELCKVINGEKLKSKMIIVANDRESIFQTIVMVDDGMGYLVNIPSVMISK